MNKQAIIYARVSTDEQAAKGRSIPNQIEECNRYAQQRGIKVVEVITDDFTGATLDRPGFMKLQEILSEGRANAVIVLTADRLSRNYVHGLVFRDQCEKARIELHYVDAGQAQDSFQSVIGDMFQYAKGHFERKDIARRTSKGKVNKAKSGRLVLNGNIPFGYKKIGRLDEAELVINPEEAEIVRMIFGWYTATDSSGPVSLLGISNRLDEMGIRPRYASFWLPASLRIIITNEIYTGRAYYQKSMTIYNGDTKRHVKRPREEWIPIDVPELAIIDKKTFDLAKTKAKQNQERARRNRRCDYLLAGHFHCAGCGLVMFGYRKHEGSNQFYRCTSYNRKGKSCDYPVRSISANKADQAVWDWLSSLLEDEATLKRGIKTMAKRRDAEIQPKKRRLDSIYNLLDRSMGKLNRLVDDLEELERGPARDAVNGRIKMLEAEQKMILKEKDQIESVLAQVEIGPEVENQIMRTAEEIRERIPDRTFANMRYLLDKLNVNVLFINEDENIKLNVSCVIPGSEREIALSSF